MLDLLCSWLVMRMVVFGFVERKVVIRVSTVVFCSGFLVVLVEIGVI